MARPAAAACPGPSCWAWYQRPSGLVQHRAASSCSFASSFVASAVASVASLDCLHRHRPASSSTTCAAASFATTFAFTAASLARRRPQGASCLARAAAAAMVAAGKLSFGGMDRSCFSSKPAFARARTRSYWVGIQLERLAGQVVGVIVAKMAHRKYRRAHSQMGWLAEAELPQLAIKERAAVA